MTKGDYIAEENRKVRAVALGLGVPYAEDLGKAELLQGIEHRGPEVSAELRDHLQKYRERWKCALAQGSTDSSKDASEAKLNEAIENALKSA